MYIADTWYYERNTLWNYIRVIHSSIGLQYFVKDTYLSLIAQFGSIKLAFMGIFIPDTVIILILLTVWFQSSRCCICNKQCIKVLHYLYFQSVAFR